MVARRKFQILKIQDGGRICTETLRDADVTVFCWWRPLIVSTQRGDTLVILSACIWYYSISLVGGKSSSWCF